MEPEPVGAELLKVVLEPKLFTWEPKKKYLEAERRKNSSAPQHWSLESESEPREFLKTKPGADQKRTGFKTRVFIDSTTLIFFTPAMTRLVYFSGFYVCCKL